MGRLSSIGSRLRTLPDRAKFEESRTPEQRRGSARARGYTAEWDREAKAHLRANPLCLYCQVGAFGEPQRVSAATLVDHIEPHRGDKELFWRRSNWASCCKPCHDGPKQAVEHRGPAAIAAFVIRLAGLLPSPAR
jgi:5-methylcytosine-specific restriction endonuclease McrA